VEEEEEVEGGVKKRETSSSRRSSHNRCTVSMPTTNNQHRPCRPFGTVGKAVAVAAVLLGRRQLTRACSAGNI
jgi:hypothetical protein